MNGKIEKKVTVSTVATYIGALVGLAVLQGVTDLDLVSLAPGWVEAVVAPLIPTLVTFLSGYAAPHTERHDLVR